MRLVCIALILLLSGCAARKAELASVPAQPPVPAKGPKPVPGDQPDKAAEFYIMKRAGEGAKDLPYDRYEAAMARVKRMKPRNRAEAAASIDLGAWQPLGPGNQGGRTPRLIIHPQDSKIMYAGAATGGVWKTVDGGANWLPVSDSFPSLGIGALSFDPNDPNTIYAGTGFWFSSLSATNVFGSAPRGGGIFRSRDAGASWEKLPGSDGTAFRYITEVIVSHNDPNRIYASTWTGVFRSLDGGQSWQQVLNRGNAGQNGCHDMAIRRDIATDYLFASCGTTVASNPGILRNQDAGGEGPWETVFSNRAMGNTTLAIAPSNPSTIYALVSSNGDDNNGAWRSSLLGVWRSTTNGDADTWEERVTNQDPNPLNTSILSTNTSFFSNVCGNTPRSIAGQAWIHNAIAVDPQDPDRVYVGGIDIYRSDDGGRNWGIASFWQAADGPNGAHADVLGLVFPPDYDAAANDRIYAATDGGVYVSENSRAELATGPRAACTLGNQVRWRPLHGGYQSTQFYSGAVTPGGGSFFGGKQDNGTMRGTLSGKGEWTRLRGGDGAAVAVDRRNPNTLFVSIQNFGLARSRNGGRTLTSTIRGLAEPTSNFAFIAPLAMDPTDSNRLYAGGRILHRTVDQADNWVPISTQMTTAQGYVSAVAVAPSDPTHVVYATNQGFLFRTDNALEADASTVWTFVRPRPGYVPAVAFDPNNADVVYAVYSQFNTAAGQNHVYRSTDGGRTWEGIDREGDSGIPDIPVLAVTVDPLDSNRIYLGTDLGVFVSTDNGATWMRDQSPFAAVPTEALVIERNAGNSYLYAFTFGRGVWRTLLPGSTGITCDYKTEATSALPAPAFGGEASVRLTAGDGCVWTAVPDLAGPDVLTPTGTGSGEVRYAVPFNVSQTGRTMGFTLQDQRVAIQQAGALTAPAAADSLATAAAVSVLPYVSARDSRAATTEQADRQASCAATPPSKTLWYRVTAPANGTMEVVSQGQRYDVAGNSGLVVSAFAANGSAPGDELGCVAQARNTGGWVFRGFQVPVTAGRVYLIQASATGTTPQDGGYTVIGVRMVN